MNVLLDSGSGSNDQKEKKHCLTPSPWKNALMSTFTNNTITSIMFSSNDNNDNRTDDPKNATETPSPWKRAAKSILSINHTDGNAQSYLVKKRNSNCGELKNTPLNHSSRVIMEWPTDEKTISLLNSNNDTTRNSGVKDVQRHSTNKFDSNDECSQPPNIEDDDATQTYDILEDDMLIESSNNNGNTDEQLEASKLNQHQYSLPATQDSFPAHVSTPDRAHIHATPANNSMVDPNVSPISFLVTPKPPASNNISANNNKYYSHTKQNKENKIVQDNKWNDDTKGSSTVLKNTKNDQDKLTSLLMLLSYEVEKKDRSIWKFCKENGLIHEFCENDLLNCSFAISTLSVYETCDGFIVPRTYFYLLAVAQGIPIVDFSLVRDYYKNKRNNNNNNSLESIIKEEFSSSTDQEKNTKRGKKKNKIYKVIGDVEATNWNGPQKSREMCLNRRRDVSNFSNQHPNILCNGLLLGYKVFLYGEFDTISSRRTTNTVHMSTLRRKGTSSMYTVGRITLLLQLCGATIVSDLSSKAFEERDMNEKSNDDKSNPMIILIRPNPQARDFRRAEKFLSTQNASNLPIIKCNWLLDSIAEFEEKPIKNYTKE